MTSATAARERPILFQGEMVRAILDGRKTQTRRVVKAKHLTPELIRRGYQVGVRALLPEYLPHCPYGQPGDRLWVRETWGTVRMHELGQHIFGDGPIADRDQVVYRAGRRVFASENAPEDFDMEKWPVSWTEDRMPDSGRWRPSIHMPRWASRITLEITEVRVERLQEINGEDVRAEGFYALADFAGLWERLNGKGDFAWAGNPWVWVIGFRKLEVAP